METMTRRELKAKLDTGEDIKLVMTVGGWTFRARHIPGSISFPSPSCALRELRRDDAIILYSTNQHLQSTAAAFHALKAQVASASPRGSSSIPAWSRSSLVTCTDGRSTASAVPSRPR
jgi:hypothetical protein